MLKGHLYHTIRTQQREFTLNDKMLTEARIRDFILETTLSYKKLSEINDMKVGDTVHCNGTALTYKLTRVR